MKSGWMVSWRPWWFILLGLLWGGCNSPRQLVSPSIQPILTDSNGEAPRSPSLEQQNVMRSLEENGTAGTVDFSKSGFGCNMEKSDGNKTLLELGLWLTVFGGCVIVLAWRTARIQRVHESA